MIKGRKSKRSSNKKNKSSKGNNNDKQKLIQLSEGWNKINKVGIKPFFARVENMDSNKLQNVSIDKKQYIEVYDTVFTMCIQREPHNFSHALYEKHSLSLTKQFKDKFIPLLTAAKTKNESSVTFLKEWNKRWKCNKWNVIGMTRMFMYLDRFFVPNSEDLLNTTQKGFTLYKDIVFKPFKSYAKTAILNCIERERNGDRQDRDLLRDAILVFVELGNKLKKVDLSIYKDEFDQYLISESKQFYQIKSREMLDLLSCPKYLIFAEQTINDERSRLNAYIDKYSEKGLLSALKSEILKAHTNELLFVKKDGINSILDRTVQSHTAKEDLSRLFRLFSDISDGNAIISEAVCAHITDLGKKYIEKSKNSPQNSSSAHELIAQLIALHTRFLTMVKTEFESHSLYHKALKKAFETFINSEYYVSGLLARYANDLLKKGSKLNVSASALEETMDSIVMLYGYIRDKDIFERDYQLYLASRLLQNLSENEQSERSMIGKLKNEAGYHWTQKLEDMFKDLVTSKELMEEFKRKNNENLSVDISVITCTMGAWLDSSIHPIRLPYTDLGMCADKFKQFYLSRFNGRKMRFQMDKGKADVQVRFNGKVRKILVVSTYQMLILLLFNDKKTLTFQEMKQLTHIRSEDLQTAILSMAHPKIKIVRKAPNTKDLCDDHKFQINPNYNNPKTRVIVPILQIGSNSKKSYDKIDPKIEVSRRYITDAAIVRTMKTRKTLEHKVLITEVAQQLIKRFNPKPINIKKRIESLIEQDYLRRDENDRKVYHYIA